MRSCGTPNNSSEILFHGFAFFTGYLAEAFYRWISKHMHHRKVSSTKVVTLSALELELEVLLRKKLLKKQILCKKDILENALGSSLTVTALKWTVKKWIPMDHSISRGCNSISSNISILLSYSFRKVPSDDFKTQYGTN